MNQRTASENYDLGKKVSYVTLAVNIILSGFKLVAGFAGHSAAMISDAIHSASDVLSTLVVLVGLKISATAADNKHQYGHERFEAIAAFILSSMLFATALSIGSSGLKSISSALQGDIPTPSAIALIAAFSSIVIKEWMYWYTRAAAKKTGSGALMADAWHHRSDALSSIGAVVGIGGAMLGFSVLDPMASLVICVLIAKAAWDIAKDAVSKLTDHATDDETEQALTRTILRNSKVIKIDEMRTRVHADKLFVDVEIVVGRYLSLLEAHEIAEEVHTTIELELPVVKHCMVHVNPEDYHFAPEQMPILCWNDQYLTGIELLDNQHKELFMLLNLYAAKCDAHMDFEETMGLLGNLTDYTMRHFQAEEAFMKNSGYPPLAEHQKHHKNMGLEVQRYATLLRQSEQDKVALCQAVKEFIHQWLITHIAVEDQAFATFYRETHRSGF